MLLGFVAIFKIAISVAVSVSLFWPVAVLTIDRALSEKFTGGLNIGNSEDSLRHTFVLLNKHQISVGGACLLRYLQYS